MTGTSGRVFLVGAGPGDPGLITVRGLDLVRRADVIVHDQLGAPAFLHEARPDAELIDVGKRAGDHTMSQDDINRILVERAKAGKQVVRLKGGDPLVFGRGGEEALAVRRAGVEFEIVPGVSSTIAGPAYAGIPITQRGYTSAVALVTGHEAADREQSTIPFPSLAGIETLVFVMGVKQLPQIADQLIAAGKAPSTPVAVIERATTPRQRTVEGQLRDIAEQAKAAQIQAPALIVVGRVVELRQHLDWFEHRPLSGHTIVVTRSRGQASELADRLRALGADVIICPTIRFEPLVPNPAFDRFLDEINTYQYVTLTSSNGVEGMWSSLLARGGDLRRLAGRRVIAIGSATAAACRERGLLPDFVPETFVAEALLPWFEQQPRGRVAILRAEKARQVLNTELPRLGYAVEVVPLYRTVAERPAAIDLAGMLRRREISAVTFTSSSTVDNFLEQLADTDVPRGQIPAVAIGPATAATCRQAGLGLLDTACEHTIDGLVAGLERLLGRRAGMVAGSFATAANDPPAPDRSSHREDRP